MKDRVRETLFNLLGPDVAGALAIDLFAGSGALAFEAISRGAARAILAERHFPTAELLRRSAQSLGVADRVAVRPGDSLLWAKQMPPLPADLPWIVFVSPPWSFFADRFADLGPLIEAFAESAPPRSIVVVESDSSFDPARLPRADAWRSRALEPAVLHLWKRGDAMAARS